MVETMEALLIESLEPPLNRRRGDNLSSIEYIQTPNPQIDFSNSPFFVNTRLTEWPRRNDQPRRAGVSSFGLGGTNAHVILDEAPPIAASRR